MASYYNYHHPAASASAHHHGRARRAPRLPQNAHKQQQAPHQQHHPQQHHHAHFRATRKDEDSAALVSFRQRFESQRSFDIDDDLEFCPTLLSDVDMVSITSSLSDRSSLASASPESSPQSHSVALEPNFSLNSHAAPYAPAAFTAAHQTPLKLHQPAATRARSAIPIVNPSTGLRMSSPPASVSPARMHPAAQRW